MTTVMRVVERLVAGAWFYWFAKGSFYAFARLFLGLRIHGVERLPRKSGFVVASNHFSSWDPPVLGVSVPGEIHYMAKKELFEKPLPRLLMTGLRAFPVDRTGNDIGAIKAALRRLRGGVSVGIFAQGTRNRGDAEAFDGAAFLAQRADVPLVPAAIWREGRGFHVSFGDPIYPVGRSRSEITAATVRLMADLNALMPEGREPYELGAAPPDEG